MSRIKLILIIIGAFLLGLLFIAVIYGLISSIAGSIRGSGSEEVRINTDGSQTPVATPAAESSEELVDRINNNYSNSEVTMYARGPIVSREDRYEIKVVITPTRRTVDVYQGYEGKRIDGDSLPNDAEAYREFLLAAKRAGLFIYKEVGVDPEEGYCYSKETRTYSVTGLGEDFSTWSSSCDLSAITPNDKYLLRLVKDQFPDYGQYIEAIE